MTERRYLPIENPDGTWIDRPDLFLLVRMAYPDSEDEQVIRQVYDTLVRANNALASLNSFEQDINKRVIRQNMRYRAFAGQTVLELVRIAATTGKPPSITQAIRLSALNHYSHFKRSSARDLEREVRKGFSTYRNTAHLQAAAVLADPSVEAIEASFDGFDRFLARAKGFEAFIDTNVDHNTLKWVPWRVPESIAANSNIRIAPLNSNEQAYLHLD